MPSFMMRLRRVPTQAPEWGEVLTGLIALGWAEAFANGSTFGPPHTTVAYMIAAFGSMAASAWAVSAALLPLISIGIGNRLLRLTATVICGLLWSTMLYVSVRAGLLLSIGTACGAVALMALMRSQWTLVHGP